MIYEIIIKSKISFSLVYTMEFRLIFQDLINNRIYHFNHEIKERHTN